jgi:putative acetyltransferase
MSPITLPPSQQPVQRAIAPFPSAATAFPSQPQEMADVPGITIRRATLEDCKGLYPLLNDAQMVYWTAELPLTSLEMIQEQVRLSSNQHFLLVACAGEEIVGTLTLTQCDKPRLRHTARVGQVAVSHDWQRRGVGTELVRAAIELADSWLNLVRLELYVYTDNESAIRLYQKFGFVSEGTLRRIAFRAGHYADCMIMARINDWAALG